MSDFFSSPEHEVLMVSYCGQCPSSVVHRPSCIVRRPLSVVRRQQPDKLTRYLEESVGVTYRSKIAKIVQIGNPRCPPWPPSWKSIFRFFSWTERPIDSKLARKHLVICRSKIAKIVPIGNPRWPPWPPSWKSIFRFFSWIERPIDSNLAGKQPGDL